MEDLKIFEKSWQGFEKRLRMKLLKKAESSLLTRSVANLLLNDEASIWGTEYDEAGIWLRNIEGEDPDKGRLIRRILTEDMSLNDIEQKKEISQLLEYAVPLAGAAAGLALSSCFNAPLWAKCVSTAAPAVLMYPAVKAVRQADHEKAAEETVNAYMEQLEKYRASVISVISS